MLKPVIRVALISLLMGSLLAACGSDDKNDNASNATTTEASAKAPTLAVSAKEYSFTTPASVQGGYVKISLDNQGTQGHQALVARLNDGVTQAQLAEAGQKDPSGESVLGLVTLKGGVNGIAPGSKQSVVSKLNAGNYLMICFLPAPDGQTHAQKGMVTPFTVTSPENTAGEPKYTGEIDARDFAFDVPTLKAGETTIEFKNNGPSPHEGTLYKLAAGKTADDAKAFLDVVGADKPPTGPPPFTEAGGAPAIGPGSSAFPTLNLEPGTYVFTCFIPDQKTGKRHVLLGMFKAFEVK
jgi:hypothetical protein